MASKQSRYLKRPEDFSYRVEEFDRKDIGLLETLIDELQIEEGLADQLKWKLQLEDTSHYSFFSAKDGFTNQLAGFCCFAASNDHGVFRLENLLVHPNHAKRGLMRVLIQAGEKHLTFPEVKFRCYTLAFDGKVKAFERQQWKHSDDLLILEKSKLRCRFSDRKTFQNHEIKTSSAKKAIAEGWQIALSSDAAEVLSEKRAMLDLETPFSKFVVIRISQSIADYILFRISKDTIIFYDYHFTQEEYQKALISFLNNEVTNKGFRKLIAYCPQRSSRLNELKEMGFTRNPFSFGGSNAKFPILSKNVDELEGSDELFQPLHFNYQYWGDYLNEY